MSDYHKLIDMLQRAGIRYSVSVDQKNPTMRRVLIWEREEQPGADVVMLFHTASGALLNVGPLR